MRTFSKWYWNKCDDGIHRPVGVCTVCGKEYKSDNIGASSYCSECARRIKKEKTAERVRRFRKKQKAEKQQEGE